MEKDAKGQQAIFNEFMFGQIVSAYILPSGLEMKTRNL
jgi:hypothetical protein